MTKNAIILILIFIFALLLRLTMLDSRPAGFTWDEAALGYNAYSILKTGRDEFGQLAPIIFKSFGDYKPGLYVYLAVPSISFFGLNEFATRFPSAVIGSILVLVVYVLAYQISKSPKVAVFSSICCALFPWAIHFSRGAWEANISLVLFSLGVALFFQYITNKKSGYIFFSFIFFGLTFITYQSAKLITPLLLACLLVIYKKQINFRQIILPTFFMTVLLLPVLIGLNSQSGRLRVASVFSYSRDAEFVSGLLNQDGSTTKDITYYLFHSESLDRLRGIAKRYLNHFSPRFLFSEGDWMNLRHTTFRIGNLYLIDFVTLIIGFITLFGIYSRHKTFILLWLLISPIPSAFSRDLVSGVRSLSMIVPLSIIVGIGLSKIFEYKKIRMVFLLIYSILFLYYLEFYYFHSDNYSAKDWVAPYKQAFALISEKSSDYSNIYFTNQLGQPYIFALFYLKYDPARFQKEYRYIENTSGDVGEIAAFGKYHFQPIYWPVLRGVENAIFVGGEYELPEKDLNIDKLIRLGNIYYPTKEVALRAVAIK